MDNLHMTASGGMVSVGWAKGAARYHVWLAVDRSADQIRAGDNLVSPPIRPFRIKDNPDGMKRMRRTLYCNPLLSVQKGEPGDFKCKYLDADAKAHSAMVAEALTKAESLGLFEAAIAKLSGDAEAKRKAETAERAAKMRAALTQERDTLCDDGQIVAANAITIFLLDATDASLERFFLIVRRA